MRDCSIAFGFRIRIIRSDMDSVFIQVKSPSNGHYSLWTEKQGIGVGPLYEGGPTHTRVQLMLELLVIGLWFALGAYGIWYLCKAKTCQPLTPNQIIWTWELHKRETGCDASQIHSLVAEDGIPIGFKCDCGYEFIQRRLITQRIRTTRYKSD